MSVVCIADFLYKIRHNPIESQESERDRTHSPPFFFSFLQRKKPCTDAAKINNLLPIKGI